MFYQNLATSKENKSIIFYNFQYYLKTKMVQNKFILYIFIVY